MQVQPYCEDQIFSQVETLPYAWGYMGTLRKIG